ncbi:DoxX family protein [Paenibacillus pinistramenti]|uniref:DoxX family protein n=1 Tax=Paenibacillus pinistramenti TaxID=1768003 RepID=UPI0011094229|nr:DoxX family protein [Paenibacillus pinistramenti]
MKTAAILLEILLLASFLGSGLAKVCGLRSQVDNFRKMGLPQWFRVVTGLMQLIGAALLTAGFWAPSWSVLGGIWFGFMMLFALITHIRNRDPFLHRIPAIVLLLAAACVILLQASKLGGFPG